MVLSFFNKKQLVPGLIALCALAGCGIIREKQKPDALDPKAMAANPLTPEEAKGLLDEVGSNWLYGQGVGDTAVNVGAMVAFPPYALVLIGNAALSVSGYEPVALSDTLPEEPRAMWRETYDEVTSVPGRAAASAAGTEFRTPEVAEKRLERYLKRDTSSGQSIGQQGNISSDGQNRSSNSTRH